MNRHDIEQFGGGVHLLLGIASEKHYGLPSNYFDESWNNKKHPNVLHTIRQLDEAEQKILKEQWPNLLDPTYSTQSLFQETEPSLPTQHSERFKVIWAICQEQNQLLKNGYQKFKAFKHKVNSMTTSTRSKSK